MKTKFHEENASLFKFVLNVFLFIFYIDALMVLVFAIRGIYVQIR
jgi:hypothetical protein